MMNSVFKMMISVFKMMNFQFDAPAPGLFGFWVSNDAPKDAPL